MVPHQGLGLQSPSPGQPSEPHTRFNPPLTDGETEAREFGGRPEVTELGSGRGRALTPVPSVPEEGPASPPQAPYPPTHVNLVTTAPMAPWWRLGRPRPHEEWAGPRWGLRG